MKDPVYILNDTVIVICFLSSIACAGLTINGDVRGVMGLIGSVVIGYLAAIHNALYKP